MKILALEFSTDRRSVALHDNGTGQTFSAVLATGARATNAFALIEQTLRAAHLERKAIECLVVGLGPGSYMGIRVAISVAQGWQLARGVKLLGVSSVASLAAQAHAAGLRGRVRVAVDAQRSEWYLATYTLTDDAWSEVEPLRIAPLAEAQTLAANGEVFIGPEVRRWFLQGQEFSPDATALAQLATAHTDFVPGENLEPIYLRETNFVKAPPPRVIA